ncbi:MAG: PilN domain-containing protein [Bacteroidales bacterium]|nr:PilN domain-containing protein [Bacteroidales bacterium]
MKKDVIWPCRVSAVVLTVDTDGNHSLERIDSEGAVSVVFVTGEAVGCKDYETSNPIVRRIESNKDLYVSVHDAATIDYVRKSVVDSAVMDSECKVIEVVVCKLMDSVDIEAHIGAARQRRLSISALKQDMPLVDHLASRLLKRFLLPVLIVYLAVLLANFIVHSELTERLGEMRSTYARESAEAKKRSEITQAQERLFADYRVIQDVNMSGLADDVASLLPDDMRLTSLVFNNMLVEICGDAFSSETVMSFVDSLRDKVECESVNVISLEKDRKEDLFRFEIHMML